MYAKILAILGVVAIANAGVFELPQAHYGHAHAAQPEPFDSHPKYEFKYGIQDGHTGDHKTQHEIRDGDVVKGSYTVADPDGTLRTVHYTADDHNGFNAIVKKSGHPVHPAPSPAYAKAAPAYYHHVLALLGVVAIVNSVGFETSQAYYEHAHAAQPQPFDSSYTVADPDGTLRTVHYTADDHNGFNAIVEKSGHPVHPARASAYAKAEPAYYHH